MKSRATYADVEAILDTALRMNSWPAYVVSESYAAAVVWRSRASKFRVLCRTEEETRLGLPPGQGTSIYDHLIFTIDRNEAKVGIQPRPVSATTLHVAGQAIAAKSDRELNAEEEIAVPGSNSLGLEVKS